MDAEVVEPSDDHAHDENLGLLPSLLSRHKNLCSGRRLGEGELSMHLRDEILPEGDHEEDAQDPSKEGCQEDIPEVDPHSFIQP